jgi:hypothetical protein
LPIGQPLRERSPRIRLDFLPKMSGNITRSAAACQTSVGLIGPEISSDIVTIELKSSVNSVTSS